MHFGLSSQWDSNEFNTVVARLRHCRRGIILWWHFWVDIHWLFLAVKRSQPFKKFRAQKLDIYDGASQRQVLPSWIYPGTPTV
jgi:hypothetical protein